MWFCKIDPLLSTAGSSANPAVSSLVHATVVSSETTGSGLAPFLMMVGCCFSSSSVTWGRCYEFKIIFAQFCGEKIGVFCSNNC
jgi:hypothetical protein